MSQTFSPKRSYQDVGLGYCAARSHQRAPVREHPEDPFQATAGVGARTAPLGMPLRLGKSGAIRADCGSVSNGAIRPNAWVANLRPE